MANRRVFGMHRFPQLRWSKRHPGKYRWVLYEMWPLTDPISQSKAVLVCEQNISQVKALEEQFKKQNQRYAWFNYQRIACMLMCLPMVWPIKSMHADLRLMGPMQT